MTRDEKILEIYPVGTMLWSTIGQGGGTEVFTTETGLAYPFSYLDDYNPEHYTTEKPKDV